MGNIIRALQGFYLASGLKINVSKSNLHELGVSSQDIEDMASHTGLHITMKNAVCSGLICGAEMGTLDVNNDCRLSDHRVHDAWVWNWNRPIIGSRNEAALALLVSELRHVIFLDRPDSWRWNMENDGIFTVHVTRSHIDACMLPSISLARLG
nr:hypothetical protein [Tanacetum cinerariifolium]